LVAAEPWHDLATLKRVGFGNPLNVVIELQWCKILEFCAARVITPHASRSSVLELTC
jgi:hypothetical protein